MIRTILLTILVLAGLSARASAEDRVTVLGNGKMLVEFAGYRIQVFDDPLSHWEIKLAAQSEAERLSGGPAIESTPTGLKKYSIEEFNDFLKTKQQPMIFVTFFVRIDPSLFRAEIVNRQEIERLDPKWYDRRAHSVLTRETGYRAGITIHRQPEENPLARSGVRTSRFIERIVAENKPRLLGKVQEQIVRYEDHSILTTDPDEVNRSLFTKRFIVIPASTRKFPSTNAVVFKCSDIGFCYRHSISNDHRVYLNARMDRNWTSRSYIEVDKHIHHFVRERFLGQMPEGLE